MNTQSILFQANDFVVPQEVNEFSALRIKKTCFSYFFTRVMALDRPRDEGDIAIRMLQRYLLF